MQALGGGGVGARAGEKTDRRVRDRGGAIELAHLAHSVGHTGPIRASVMRLNVPQLNVTRKVRYMSKTEKSDSQPREAVAKKPYVKPSLIQHGKVFETAALSCGKVQSTQGSCRLSSKTS